MGGWIYHVVFMASNKVGNYKLLARSAPKHQHPFPLLLLLPHPDATASRQHAGRPPISNAVQTWVEREGGCEGSRGGREKGGGAVQTEGRKEGSERWTGEKER